MSAQELEQFLTRVKQDPELDRKFRQVEDEAQLIALAEEAGLTYTTGMFEEFMRRRIADDPT